MQDVDECYRLFNVVGDGTRMTKKCKKLEGKELVKTVQNFWGNPDESPLGKSDGRTPIGKKKVCVNDDYATCEELGNSDEPSTEPTKYDSNWEHGPGSGLY